MTGRQRSRDLDEDDVRVRPGRGKSRPRTKDRPGHHDALPGWVVSVDRGRFGCLVGDGPQRRTVVAMTARELGHKAVVVGDQVWLVGDLDAGADQLARIVRVEPRRSVLRRTADDTDPVERVVVANAEQLAIVTSVSHPEPRTRLVDRALTAAFDAGLAPVLVITKTDLGSPADLLRAYAAVDLPYVATARTADGLALGDLPDRLAGRRTVLVGHSGVGKSTLVNRLIPGTARATGPVNAVTGRGRHTSTSTVVLELPGGGWVIDTPGIRSFGLAHVDPARVVRAFADLYPGTTDCPRSCSHDEPDCALDRWVADGHAEPARLDSLRRLLRARALPDTD